MSVAFDFSEVPGPSSDEIKAHGGEGALTYGTGAQQSPEYIAGLEADGLHTVEIWEHNTDSIVVNDYHYGVTECQAWEATHLAGKLVYLACDLNDGALSGRDLTPVLHGWADTTRESTFGLYGSDDAIREGMGSGITKLSRWWGVVNWIRGGAPDNAQSNIDFWTNLGAHLVQLIGSPLPGTDQNLILKPDWWTTGPATSNQKGTKPTMYITLKGDTSGAIWITDGQTKRWVTADEWKFANDLAAYTHTAAPSAVPLSQDWWNSLPIINAATVDVVALSKLLAPLLGSGSGLKEADVEQALRNVLHGA